MHEKSRLGTLLDKVKTSTLVVFLALGFLVSGVVLYFLNMAGSGIAPTFQTEHETTFWDAMYFSVVTISSLGYGDYRPIGWGRAVAAFEVVYGLFFLAVIVSKLASERTSTLIKLVYASDTQRRLLDFIESAVQRNEKLKNAVKDNDYFTASDISLSNKTAFSTYQQFLEYHMQYGDIRNDWAAKQLVRLMKAVSNSADLGHKIIRDMHTDSEIHQRVENYLVKASNLSAFVSKSYDREKLASLHGNIVKLQGSFVTALKECDGNFEKLRAKNSIEISPALRLKVMSVTPKRPWPNQVHKLVAAELKISNKLAQKVISELMASGHFPEP